MNSPKVFHCSRIEAPEPLEALPEVLEDGEVLSFQQAWREEPEADFMPGRVRMGWEPEGFWIWAELEDRDIFNPVEEFNEPAFLKGDVFEIFLRPQDSEAYSEFHVSPRNQVFQYRIPSVAELQRNRSSGICQDWLIPSPVIESQTQIDQVGGIWQVFAKIPIARMGLSLLRAKDLWDFSFCRYDYSRNLCEPVLSSTSPYNKIDFHDQDYWMRAYLC